TTGIPGLASIPGLGWLFKGQSVESDRNELVIALIPHIVRGPDITESNLRGIAAGNATQIKVTYGPRKTDEKAAVAQAAAPAAAAGNAAAQAPARIAAPAPAPAATAPALPPATAPPLLPPATAPPDTAPITSPAVGAPALGIARVSFQPSTVDTQLTSTITVTVYGENISDMTSVAAQLKYDPRILRINNVVAG